MVQALKFVIHIALYKGLCISCPHYVSITFPVTSAQLRIIYVMCFELLFSAFLTSIMMLTQHFQLSLIIT